MAETSLPGTTLAAADAGIVEKMWSGELLLQVKRMSFLEKFRGKSKFDILFEPADISGKVVGDAAHIPLLKSLTGSGQTGDTDLEGNEEAMVYSITQMTFDQNKHGVKLAGNFEETKTRLNMRTDAKEQLGDWMARLQDSKIYTALQTSGAIANMNGSISSTLNVLFAGNAIEWDGLSSGDTISVAFIRKLKRYAAMRGIRPAKLDDGRSKYALVISQEQEYDLVRSAGYDEAQRHGNVRGESNPIFSGALSDIDGVVIHTDMLTVGGGNAATYLLNEDKDSHRNVQALLLGAQAGAFAYTKTPGWREKMFDYGWKYGIATNVIMGACKPVINLGTVAVPSTRDYGLCYACTGATKLV